MQIGLREEGIGDAPGMCARGQQRKGREEGLLNTRKGGEKMCANMEEEICWARRHEGRERAEARKGFVMSIVASCGEASGASGERGWIAAATNRGANDGYCPAPAAPSRVSN